ncbi:sensor histidine kinase [Mediterraneibacter gnavus]|uniref:sensor histidine kinase n=2 Tax=Mediterraneibacter gnavus TaxID=33038 RepID=UPI0036D3DED8
MLWVLFSVAIVIAVYFATRFFLLKKAMKEANREFQDILKDIQQNQILHMAMPDKELENMAQSVNQALEQIRTERQEYEKRERAFQSEIENISHDLRTPLTVILGYLKLMKGQKETDMEMVETIERKAKTMQRLVTDFYDLSRLSARDYEVEIKETDVGRILRPLINDFLRKMAKFRHQENQDVSAGTRIRFFIDKPAAMISFPRAVIKYL